MPPRLHEPPSQGLDAGPHQPPPSSWQAARPVIDDGLPQSVRFRCLAPHFPSWAIPESTETYTFICPTPCQATGAPGRNPSAPAWGNMHLASVARRRSLRWKDACAGTFRSAGTAAAARTSRVRQGGCRDVGGLRAHASAWCRCAKVPARAPRRPRARCRGGDGSSRAA